MKPIGFTVVSKDDFWQQKAYELRDVLKERNIDLVICSLAVDRCSKHEEKYSYYHMKDCAFIDFASQEKRAVWLLDAEIRLVGEIPNIWLEGKSVIFHKDITAKLKNDLPCVIDTGESIFDHNGVIAYKAAVEMAEEAYKQGDQYDVEAYLHTTLGVDFIRETIAMDRMRSDGLARASRGSWYATNTVIIHPYDHNWQMSLISYQSGIEMHKIASKDFINHFAPNDLGLAMKVFDLLDKHITNNEKWLSLPRNKFTGAGYSVPLSDMLPKTLPKFYSKSNHLCYLIADWVICPELRLLAPKREWNECAYFLD